MSDNNAGSTGPVDQLVQGLRDYGYEQIGYLRINETCLDAADLLEAQAARIAELEAEVAGMQDVIDAMKERE